MADTKLQTYFLSEKISRIRWVPEQLQQSERFLTGTWDMPTNHIRLWRLRENPYATAPNEHVPHCSDKIQFDGDICGLEFINENVVVAGCSDGYIALMNIKRAIDEDQLELMTRSPILHKFNVGDRAAPCTAIDVYGTDIATVGEDGRLNILNASQINKNRQTIIADNCALHALAYVNHQEVLIANRMGVIRMLDIRITSEPAPVVSFISSFEDEKRSNYISCMSSHPTQKHIVLAGSEEGSITVWDLRKPGFPASYLSAHASAITQIGFHPTEPSKLFSAAECGELWMWSQQTPPMGGIDAQKEGENLNPWLNGERAKNRINIMSLISKLRKAVNCFDAHGSRVICGSDTEAVYLIDNLI